MTFDRSYIVRGAAEVASGLEAVAAVLRTCYDLRLVEFGPVPVTMQVANPDLLEWSRRLAVPIRHDPSGGENAISYVEVDLGHAAIRLYGSTATADRERVTFPDDYGVEVVRWEPVS